MHAYVFEWTASRAGRTHAPIGSPGLAAALWMWTALLMHACAYLEAVRGVRALCVARGAPAQWRRLRRSRQTDEDLARA